MCRLGLIQVNGVTSAIAHAIMAAKGRSYPLSLSLSFQDNPRAPSGVEQEEPGGSQL